MAAHKRLYLLCARRWACCLYQRQMNISHEDLIELTEIIEDTTEYFCDQHLVSGELVWNVVLALSMAKLEELKGNIVADEEVAA